MPVKQRAHDPYNFDPGFEAALVTALSCRPKLYGRVGEHLDPECLGAPAAKLALQALNVVVRDLGSGPESVVVVLQRLRRWMHEGKTTHAEIVAVMDLYDTAEDRGLPSTEELVGEVVPVLKRRMERESIDTALQEFQRKGDPARALARMEIARRLGIAESGIGTVLGPASFEQILRLQRVVRMRTGIMELDDALDGGMFRATLTTLMAGTKVGKSMGLVQLACAGLLQGFNVACATLELPVPIWSARVKANLTGIPINAILEDPYGCGAAELLDEFQSLPAFGRITFKAFTAKVTSMTDLLSWIADVEEVWASPVNLLVVDYADKMRSRTSKGSEEQSSYQSTDAVYDDLFGWARDNDRWSATASQAKRVKDRRDKGRKLEADDVADGMGKVRNSDYVITLNARDEGEQMLYNVITRLGRSGVTAGPLPTDYAVARIGPVDHKGMVR